MRVTNKEIKDNQGSTDLLFFDWGIEQKEETKPPPAQIYANE